MSNLSTYQSSWEPVRLIPITNEETQLDGTTSGYTYDWSDHPEYARMYHVTNGANGIVLRFEVTEAGVADQAFGVRLWAYRPNGPAEFLGDFSCLLGADTISHTATALHCDTITETADTHIAGCTVYDTGNDRIAKIKIPWVGHEWLYCEFYDFTDGGEAMNDVTGTLQGYVSYY